MKAEGNYGSLLSKAAEPSAGLRGKRKEVTVKKAKDGRCSERK